VIAKHIVMGNRQGYSLMGAYTQVIPVCGTPIALGVKPDANAFACTARNLSDALRVFPNTSITSMEKKRSRRRADDDWHEVSHFTAGNRSATGSR